MSILTKADAIVNGDRQKDYGDPKKNFDRIAAIWSTILDIPVTREQVALCMIGLKMARLVNTPDHEDSWMDIAGYVGAWELTK